MNRATILSTAVLSMCFALPVNATIIVSGSSASSETAFDGNVVANDLINTGQASLGSASQTNGPSEGSFGGTNDGVGSSNGSSNAWYAGGSTVTYNLNTNPGTGGSAAGYEISAVNTFAGWGNNATFADQVYDFQVKTLSNPVFTTVQSVSYQPFTGIPNFPNDPSSTEVSLTSNSGPIATGVTAVQFVLAVPTFSGAASGTVWRELDVIGAAVPEPSSVILGVLGLVGLPHAAIAKPNCAAAAAES